ncbi:Hypothetical predicted protein [Cloeon dipterum]|uniref:Uncharacterized protein n=1 Tax=Cloeon dipterum TaxID=197152 RepID=A0A8S1C6G7_9INSE|nr:Hypothetical predicted protein [Cloeon dipterum]
MAFKFVVLAACLAVANAGLAAVGASQQSTVRSLDGNSVVSTYSKQVDTPYSSVRKYDTRVSNDAVAYAAAPVAYNTYAAPAVAHATYAAPAYTSYAAPRRRPRHRSRHLCRPRCRRSPRRPRSCLLRCPRCCPHLLHRCLRHLCLLSSVNLFVNYV